MYSRLALPGPDEPPKDRAGGLSPRHGSRGRVYDLGGELFEGLEDDIGIR